VIKERVLESYIYIKFKGEGEGEVEREVLVIIRVCINYESILIKRETLNIVN
jgi:hypothetical protein